MRRQPLDRDIAESSRTLRRLAEESDPSLGGGARPADLHDPVERLAIRVGRVLALLLTLAILIWLAATVLGG